MTRFIGIAVVDPHGVLGDGATQSFTIKEDWARYKQVTMGHPMVVGRRTHEVIGRWLPGRTTIVVSRTPDAVPPPDDPRATGHVVTSVDEALALAASLDEVVFVAGGGEVYRQAWDALTDLDLTEVHRDADVDPADAVRLPERDPAEWVEVRREPRDGFDFVGYERVRGASRRA